MAPVGLWQGRRSHQTPRSAGLWRRRQGHPTPRSPDNRRPPNSARGSGQHHAARGRMPSERAPSLPQARKARAKRRTRSIGNVTAAGLARTCVAVAISSSENGDQAGFTMVFSAPSIYGRPVAPRLRRLCLDGCQPPQGEARTAAWERLARLSFRPLRRLSPWRMGPDACASTCTCSAVRAQSRHACVGATSAAFATAVAE